jgi:hypothetical protein
MDEKKFRTYSHQNPAGHRHEEDTPYLGNANKPAKPAPSGEVRNASDMENSGDMRLSD